MKKILLSIIVVMMMIVPVSAKETTSVSESDDSFVKQTNEPAMPTINEISRYSANSNKKSRSQWVEEVIEVNENAYNQEVKSVNQTEDYYIFNFEPNPELEDEVVVINGEEYKNVQIDRILYLKPESTILSQSEISPSSTIISDPGGTNGSTKIVEYYGWSNGYVRYSGKTGIFKSVINLWIAYVPTATKLGSWILGEALGSLYNSFEKNKTITAESYNKYYYKNKAGCVYSKASKGWLPIAYVGERRSFGWAWGTYKNAYGEPIIKKAKTKNSNNSKNPTNYDSREKKAHYDNNSWIIKKAKETQNKGGYWDCFGLATTLIK